MLIFNYIKNITTLLIIAIPTCLILLFFNITTYAQPSNVDSLKRVLSVEKTYKKKVELLHQLHQQTHQNNPRESLEFPKQVLSLATQKKDNEQIARAYQQMGISYILLNEIDTALIFLSKSIDVAKTENDLKRIAACKRTIGTAFWYKNDIKKAIEYYKESLTIFEELNDRQQLATTVANLGTAYYVYGDLSKSIDYYLEALTLIDSSAYPNEMASYLNDIGTIYKEWGNGTLALEYFLRSLKINEIIDNKRNLAANIDNIGSVYLESKDYSTALNYYKKGLEIEREIDNVYGMASSYLSISTAYILRNQADSSLYFLNNALKCFNHVDDKMGLANTYSKYGEAYALRGYYEKSTAYYKEAIRIAKSIGDEKCLAYALGGIGQSYYHLSDFINALIAFNESIALSEKGNYANLLKSNYYYKYKTLKKTNETNKAIEALEKYTEVRDTIFKIEKQKQTNELLARYESEKKANEIKLLNQQNEISQSKLARQKTLTFSAIVLLLVSVIGVYLIYKRYQEKQRINTLLKTKNLEIEDKKQRIEEQNEKLEIQAKQLRELDESKSRFFTNISHEFRTPLTLIIGPTEQLIEQTQDNKVKTSLQLIQHNAKNLLGLINQLLEISRIEKGNVKLNFSEGDIVPTISLITQVFKSQSIKQNLNIEFKTDFEELNCHYDKEKLERILFNLISNSFKNTEKGKIMVYLQKSKKTDYIRIAVSDTGIGIEKKKIPYIFDRFYMANESSKMSSGIGLAFTKELIKVYKGNIHVESDLGVGSTFTVEIPINPELFSDNEYLNNNTETQSGHVLNEIIDIEVNQNKSTNSNKDSETVLIVEDHEELRKFIASNLTPHFKVIEAYNGKVGIEMTIQHMPDLIITDVMMPEVDGLEFTKTIKNNRDTSHIPIIILTAKASEESRIKGLETEADDYLTKPFSIKELIARAQNLLKIRNRLREKYIRSIQVNPTEITTNSVDEQFLSSLLKVVEDNMANSDFSVDILCEMAGVSRTTLHNKLKSLLDQSATEFINTIRAKRAAQLIEKKAGSISEIAYDVGFNNLSYFTKVFKKHIGITPSEMMER